MLGVGSWVALGAFRGLVALFRLTPFPLLYLLSDGFAFLLHDLVRYRRKVVEANLERSFPEKSAAEIARIRRAFYRNLSDIVLEGIKGISMPKEEVLRRYRFVDTVVVDRLFAEGRHVFAMSAHYGNWEWGVLSYPLQVPHEVVGIYKPIRHPRIGPYMDRRRSRFGLQLAPYYTTKTTLSTPPKTPTLYIMMSDQSPSSGRKAQWVRFLNQDTDCLHGTDHYARQNGYAVVFMDVQRVRRGYYEIRFSELCLDPRQAAEGEITQRYMQRLETIIRAKPEDWLWSHRRWKRGKGV